jgi:pyruvate/2-oxoacid:ferredoxin oxidoreductase alpha subunit
MIYGTHGEIPKIVIHPSTVEECFYDTVEAFNLADRYQCPVIVMTDLQLSLGKQSAETLDYARIKIDRGSMIGFFGGEQVFKSAGAGLEHTVQPFDRYRARREWPAFGQLRQPHPNDG